MTQDFNERLNLILPRITSQDFLSSRGLGNEIPFHVFDYPPELELEMRRHLTDLTETLKRRFPNIRFVIKDLFELLVTYLEDRKLLQPALIHQRTKGNKALFEALRGPLHENKIAQLVNEAVNPQEHDLILLHGVGSVWPLLRTHTLLNALQPIMKEKPLILFYPGSYTGQGFKLFNRIGNGNYYRAFKLI